MERNAPILDCGFWILDWVVMPILAFFNPKSAIQNPKSIGLERQSEVGARRAWAMMLLVQQ
jgi:hypothetical protein